MDRVLRALFPAALVACLLVVPVAPAAADPPAPAGGPPEVLTTPTGNPLKVLVKEPTAVFPEPKAAGGQPVPRFTWFYVLPAKKGTRDKTADGFYRVAATPAEAGFAGYVPADKVIEWNHAQVVGLRPLSSGRQQVLFFATADDLKRWYAGDTKVQPISREPLNPTGDVRLFPLLDVGHFDHASDRIEYYKLAYLHGPAARTADAGPGGPKVSDATTTVEEVRRRLKENFRVQLVVCIDTTASMEPFIEACKAVVRDLAEQWDPLESTCRHASLSIL